MLGSDARIIETGRDGVRLEHLTVLILQQIGARAVQNAGRALRECCGVMRGRKPLARRFDAVNGDRRLIEERMEQTDGVRAAADARDQEIGQPALALHQLRARLFADHGLKIAHHRRIRMRARGRADDVERVMHVRDPVAQRLVHRIFQRARARADGPHFGAQQIHAEHVRLLPLDVHLAHVDRRTEDRTAPRPSRWRRHAGPRPSRR